jgi:hypothetical protein
MRRSLVGAGMAASMLMAAAGGARAGDGSWTTDFAMEPDDLVSRGQNPYFILEPGYTLVLENGGERLTITVLDETRKVGGVETRIVEERETKGGRLKEVSRNYYAISKRTNSVFYFGEDVDMYEGERVRGHEGSWLSGVNGARHGLMMPGLPLAGSRYQQEVAPGVAMDRAEIVALNDTLRTTAGQFTGVLKVSETNPLQKLFSRENKYYAPGIGLAQDGSLKLVRHGTSVDQKTDADRESTPRQP